MQRPLNWISLEDPELVDQSWCLPDTPSGQRAPHPKLVDKLANVPKPIKWLSKCCHWGEAVAPPCQHPELNGQAWQQRLVPASGPRQRQSKWQMGWGPLGRKGGERGEVACGSLIESRSGLSWWGGGDDRGGMEGRGGGGLQGLRQSRAARRMTTGSGSARPTPLHLWCPPPRLLRPSHFSFISLFLSPLIPQHKGAEEKSMPTRRSRGCVKISQSFISKHRVPKIDCIRNEAHHRERRYGPCLTDRLSETKGTGNTHMKEHGSKIVIITYITDSARRALNMNMWLYS